MIRETLKRQFRKSEIANHLRRIRHIIAGKNQYDPERYWSATLGRFGRDLRGPGHGRLTEAENAQLYLHGEKALKKLTSKLNLSWTERFAEIGPGNGYWLRWLWNQGVRDYTAFDVTDVLFPMIRQEYAGVTLVRHDITERKFLTNLT
jgi:hypothetical protein